MELWEKEYERISSNAMKNYYNACWEEIEKPNGTKYYVPKKNKNKDIKRYYAEKVSFLKTLFKTVWNLIKFFLIYVLLFMLFGLGYGGSSTGIIITMIWFFGSIFYVIHFICFIIRSGIEGNLRL